MGELASPNAGSSEKSLHIIIGLLKSIDQKLDWLISNKPNPKQTLKNSESTPTQADMLTILEFPKGLRKTAMVLLKFKKASAQELAAETKRSRAAESIFANDLVRMNFAKKQKVGKTVYFYIENPEESI